MLATLSFNLAGRVHDFGVYEKKKSCRLGTLLKIGSYPSEPLSSFS